MNIVRELRIKKGIQQKELALELGVSSAAVSNWEKGRSDPSGERLKKLAEIFGVDELVILGQGSFVPDRPGLFVPTKPEIAGKSESEQIIERLLSNLEGQPKTAEARIVSAGMDRLPKEQREQILNVIRAMYPSQFKKEGDDAT